MEKNFYFIIGNLFKIKRCSINAINPRNMIQVRIQPTCRKLIKKTIGAKIFAKVLSTPSKKQPCFSSSSFLKTARGAHMHNVNCTWDNAPAALYGSNCTGPTSMTCETTGSFNCTARIDLAFRNCDMLPR